MEFRYLVYQELSPEMMAKQGLDDSCPYLQAGFKEFYDAADYVRRKKYKGFVFYIKDNASFKKYYIGDLRSK